ncbi:tail fiber domain-containing protein [Streptomyces sp. NBC_01429]|uniref:tail fiber domain-containing protein n=1 Tax=Streptomyces sp. NBC_01429 TaxID=2903862 RepID=UPI002E2B153E|nr:tail fiber domain-containing protein [Streptomyces sp. NBC_01429]
MRFFHRRSRAAAGAAPATPAAPVVPAAPVAPVASAGAVNGHRVLETVVALPVSTWRYLWEPEDVRHLGPMAQDWHAAFGFNQDDTTIPVVDGLGVSLVCIQALHRRVEELTAEVERLREAADAGAGASTTEPA